MIPASFDYLAPTSVAEALAALAEHGDDAKVLAGILGFLAGQNLNTLVMVAMKKRNREKGLIARMASSTGVGEFVDRGGGRRRAGCLPGIGTPIRNPGLRPVVQRRNRRTRRPRLAALGGH